MKGCWILSNVFSASIEMTVWYLPFILSIWYITLYAFWGRGVKSTLHSWHNCHLTVMYIIIFLTGLFSLVFCWGFFKSIFIRDWSVISFFCWHLSDFYIDLIKFFYFLEGYEELVLIIFYVFGRITSGTIWGWIFLCGYFLVTNPYYIVNHNSPARLGSWWEPSSCPTDGCLLAVSSHGRETDLISLHPITRTPIFSWVSSPMTSSEPTYLPKAPPPNTITLGIRASTY